MPLGTDKGITIKYLGSALGISPDQMMAFGDAENDIPMLTVVEKSYVVANAIPEMFQYGKYKANTNDQHGVTEIMSQVLNSQGEANE